MTNPTTAVPLALSAIEKQRANKFCLASISHDQRIALAYQQLVAIYAPDTGERLFEVPCPTQCDFVYGVEWSLDGRFLAVGSRPNTLRIFDAAKGTLLFERTSQQRQLTHLAFSHDATLLAVSYETAVELYETTAFTIVHTLRCANASKPFWRPGRTSFLLPDHPKARLCNGNPFEEQELSQLENCFIPYARWDERGEELIVVPIGKKPLRGKPNANQSSLQFRPLEAKGKKRPPGGVCMRIAPDLSGCVWWLKGQLHYENFLSGEQHPTTPELPTTASCIVSPGLQSVVVCNNMGSDEATATVHPLSTK